MTSANARSRLRGIIAPTVTPFDDDGALSISGVHRVVDFLATAGVDGIIPADLIGEVLSLTLDERRAVLAESVQASAGRMVVIALVADPSVHNAIELARFAAKAGADVIKLSLPYPYTPSAAAMLDVFHRIDDAADMPFVVESSDALAVPLDVIAALTERPNFIGLEEWGSDVGRMDGLFHDFSDRIAILSSGETALLFLSLLGAPGIIAAEVNFAPRLMREFLEACGRRELDRALALFGRRRRYRDLFRDGLRRGLPVFTPYAKAAVALHGLPVGRPRPPHDELTAKEIGRLREVVRRELDVVPAC